MNELYVTSTRLYGCIQTVDTNSYRLPECHYSRYENITKSYTRNVYTRIMILYGSIRLVYAFVLTHSLRCGASYNHCITAKAACTCIVSHNQTLSAQLQALIVIIQ